MKIRSQLILFIISIIIAFVAHFFVSRTLSQNLSQKIDRELNKLSTLKEANINLETDVINIWQWLTDISATRGQDGLDDGFVMAEKYYQQVKKDLNDLQEISTNFNQLIINFNPKIDNFHEIGKKMANLYIQEGTSAGNAYMADFDSAAEEMLSELDKLRLGIKNIEREISLQVKNTINKNEKLGVSDILCK